MTQDFKDLTLKYITGNITPGQEQLNTFRDNKQTSTDIITALADKGISVNIYKILTTTTTSNYLIYGGYISNGEQKGFIVVLDQDSNILEIITKYDSGTDLGYIFYLDYDENGNIYGLDEVEGQTYNRIILLNNVALETPKGYLCKLRSSYYIRDLDFDTPFQDYSVPHLIRKVQNEATYFILGQKNEHTTLLKFVNNVGMPNEWTYYEGEDTSSTVIQKYDLQVEKVGDDYHAYLYYTFSDTKKLQYQYFNGTSLTNHTEQTLEDNIDCIRIVDKDTAYISTIKDNGNDTFTLTLYKKEGELFLLNKYTLDGTSATYYLNIENGIVYGEAIGRATTNGVTDYKIVCMANYDGTTVSSDVIELSSSTPMRYNTIVQRTFALYKFILLSDTSIYHPSVVIYDKQYSGGAYESVDSLTAQKGELYSNGYIVFARSLYNRQVFNNVTTSTIEVPNGYLNDLTIDTKNVLSMTNNIIDTDSTQLEKNIYEKLFLNFTNYLSVIDDDTDTFYPGTASYINKNINDGSTYENSRLSKVRINYSGTPIVQNITWTKVGSHYETSFTIDTTNVPTSIDFISEDESTIYITKELDVEVNKYYVVSQKLKIV